MIFMHACDGCGSDYNERVFRDTYTGLAACLECLSEIAGQTTMSPSEDGDNFRDLLSAVNQ